jgi:hypothetical protein
LYNKVEYIGSSKLQSAVYTIASLKKEYKTLAAAKAAHDIKASSWAALAEKLNTPSVEQLQTEIERLKAENTALKQQLTEDRGFDLVSFWLQDGNFERSRLEDFGISKDVLDSTSAVKKVWKELSLCYHPDKGGTQEQQANLNRLQNQMMAMASLAESVNNKSTKKRTAKPR